MFPNIWFIDTYSVMLLMGVSCCFIFFYLYGMKHNFGKKYIYDVLLLACGAIMCGLLFAFLFQKLFDLLKENSTNSIGSMTFFGGLVGGIIGFIIGYLFFIKSTATDAENLYPAIAAFGVLLTLIAVPTTLIVKYLLERFGPSED